MERWLNKVALVTGAGSGIGAGFSRSLVEHGVSVIGCDLQVEKVQELKAELKGEKGTLIDYHCDLRRSEEITKMFDFIVQRYGGVDICLNCAGVVTMNTLLDGNTDEWNSLMAVNVTAVVQCTQMSIKNMRERNVTEGCIVIMNSRAGHKVGGKCGHIYTASKFALTTITEGFRRELREIKSPIRISQISPGVVATGIYQAATGCTDEERDTFYANTPHLSTADMNDALVYILSTPPSVEVHDIILAAH